MRVINKIMVVSIVVLLSLVYIIFGVVNNKKEEVELDEVILKEEKVSKSSSFAIMLQNDNGEYAESNSNAYPTEEQGYRFNNTKSGCINNKGELVENALSFNNGVLNISVGESVQCYTYFDKLYTVTYDLNGGTFNTPFDETPSVKEVAYGDNYGDLPTPTREGYTFKGWNGKNKFNKEKVLVIVKSAFINNQIIFDGSSVSDNVSYGITIHKSGYGGSYLESLYYTTTLGYQNFTFKKTSDFIYLNIKQNTSKADSSFYYNINHFIDNNNYTLSFSLDYYNASEVKSIISNLQLEEGTEATEYEPYYVTSDTKVVQRQNHTLKAIWEANS